MQNVFNTHFELYSSNSGKLGEGIQQRDKNFKYFSTADNSFSHDEGITKNIEKVLSFRFGFQNM